MSTKERILDAALTLFAKNGYSGTSVEQIAEIVGIKAPSLYKHFKGKEDILNTLIDSAEARYEKFFGSSTNLEYIPENIEIFKKNAIEGVRFTISDPLIRKIRIFLVQEQFRNERLAKITTHHQIDGLLQMYSKILEGMICKGLIKNYDPVILALELTAPATVLISKADRQPEYKNQVLEILENHVRHFCDIYKK